MTKTCDSDQGRETTDDKEKEDKKADARGLNSNFQKRDYLVAVPLRASSAMGPCPARIQGMHADSYNYIAADTRMIFFHEDAREDEICEDSIEIIGRQ